MLGRDGSMPIVVRGLFRSELMEVGAALVWTVIPTSILVYTLYALEKS